MNIDNQDSHIIKSLDANSDFDNPEEEQPELISYESMRQALWPIHEFVREVLASDAPGFRIIVNKHGRRIINPLSLGRKYGLMNNFMSRIPFPCNPNGLINLFLECCIELKLYYDYFSNPADPHRCGMIGAELFNALILLIRKRAREVDRYKKYLRISKDFDLVEFNSIMQYVDALFRRNSKILVIRVDLGYSAQVIDQITFKRAHRDIKRFINNRGWHRLFNNCVGFIIGREKGSGSDKENGGSGRGYHFHCYIFFNGQEVNDDIDIAKQIIGYWDNRIVNSRCTPEEVHINTWTHNCNLDHGKYRFNGIGMINHFDELKRSNLLYALLYLTKNSQELGEDAPARSRSISKGQLKPLKEEFRGALRHLLINGEKVRVPKKAMFV